MTGRELAASLLALPNPDLPVITRETDFEFRLATGCDEMEDASMIWGLDEEQPVGPFIIVG